MKASLAAVCLVLPQALFAQALQLQFEKVAFERERVPMGQGFSFKVDFKGEKVYCGMQINFGDGEMREVRAEQIPTVVNKTYARAGTYTIYIEGVWVFRGLNTAAPCKGTVVSAPLLVFDLAEEDRKAAERAEAERVQRELERLRRKVEEDEARARQERIDRENAASAAAASAAAAAAAAKRNQKRPAAPAASGAAASGAASAPPKKRVLPVFN